MFSFQGQKHGKNILVFLASPVTHVMEKCKIIIEYLGC